MAARTSAGTGMLVTVTVVSVLALALLITTVIFYSGRRAALNRVADLSTNVAEIIREDERNRDDVARIRTLAKAQNNKSVVGYLVQQQQDLMQRVTGSGRDALEDLNRKLGADFGEGNLLAGLQERGNEIAALTKRVGDAEASAKRALADKEAEVARVKDIEASQAKTLTELNGQVDQYKAEVDQLRDEVASFKGELDTRVQRMRDEGAGREAQLAAELDKNQRQGLLDRSLIQRLQNELKGQRYVGQSEEALVDGKVIGLNAADSTVVIGVGRKQRLVLGTSFEVYSDGTAIRPDAATGEYPSGKASLEVIRLDDDSATARIIRERKGNPIVRGDVIANALYDPKKVYTFLVYGLFDANKDGRASLLEASDISALVTEWGGKVVDELSGNVDFVVLGQRPTLPPEPPATAPAEVVQEFIRLKRQAVKYDELLAQARATSIPVLNENRLYTLTGQR